MGADTVGNGSCNRVQVLGYLGSYAGAEPSGATSASSLDEPHGQRLPSYHPLGGMVPQFAPCASSGRARRPLAARHSQGEAQPPGAPPRPRGLKRAGSEVTECASFDKCRYVIVATH